MAPAAAAPPSPFTDYADVQDYLFSLKARGVKYGIDRMGSWVAALGHPERAVPAIHITGTNGKGSTAAMLEAIFREAGWRTGLYTSPHLVRLGERVQVDRVSLTEAEIIDYTNALRPIAEDVSRESPDDHPSFFEFMTAMAFWQFERKRCDIGIIEVGMGGRLDATNIVLPEVSVITSISLDHCEMLGDTPEKIAAEKAGIIKPGRPVVIGHVPPAAERVIREAAARAGSQVHSIAEEFGADFAGYPPTNLEGDYQRWNAATAALTARMFPARWRLTGETVARGLMRVDWPGRWERVTVGGQPFIFDASHNPEGAQVLDANLDRLRAGLGGRRLIVITGALGEARARALLEVAARHARELHLVVPAQSRACTHAQLESYLPGAFSGRIHRADIATLFPVPNHCVLSDPDAPIIVTGSLYLIGEIFTRLQEGAKGEGRLQDF
ncbi:bifunctional folylpolyglutamate synthase/dihydrofolate synthase [Termitidicoccus mucosus]|uniref:tetrahydrofolate synthase n=1 Tax=Termitidicoccus mucosus TaxID=1184151 RepID=A0A178IAM7_9BACT|nr:bifunctional folylpolyglutamate synthase/dihydrofolate synthase [Opitutaceae bacterium TSB47]